MLDPGACIISTSLKVPRGLHHLPLDIPEVAGGRAVPNQDAPNPTQAADAEILGSFNQIRCLPPSQARVPTAVWKARDTCAADPCLSAVARDTDTACGAPGASGTSWVTHVFVSR